MLFSDPISLSLSDDELRAVIQARFDAQIADGPRRIQEWYDRGYVHYSDVGTHSTHLLPVNGGSR